MVMRVVSMVMLSSLCWSESLNMVRICFLCVVLCLVGVC